MHLAIIVPLLLVQSVLVRSTPILLPLPTQECSTFNVHANILKVLSFARECEGRLEFDNCCEPILFRYNWLRSTVYPVTNPDLNRAYCDMETDGGGWLVILRREPPYSLRFNRTSFRAYERGFGTDGDMAGEFWLGLRNINYFCIIAAGHGTELRIDLQKEGVRYYAHYEDFDVDPRNDYTLRIGGYRNESTLPDSLSHSNGFRFTVKNTENISAEVGRQYNGSEKCTSAYNDAWWHGARANETCTRVSLLKRVDQEIDGIIPEGLIWEIDGTKEGFDWAEMKIRPRKWECGLREYTPVLFG